ncbi:hypothetical protein [Nocardioides ultimimeridianus]
MTCSSTIAYGESGWWEGAYDKGAERAQVSVVWNGMPFTFRFEHTSPTSATVRFDISENAADTSPGSSSPSLGWLTWYDGYAVALENENFTSAERWDGGAPFAGDDVEDLDERSAVAGYAHLAAEILWSQYGDDTARALYRTAAAERP